MTPKDRNALDFVLAGGMPFEQWRAERLLGTNATGLPPADWAKGQLPSGGFPSPVHPPNVACTGATCGTLTTMAFLGLAHTPEALRALAFMWDVQQTDGRWTEPPDQDFSGLPPWFQKDIAVDLWETANSAGTLAALGYGQDHRVVRAIAWAEPHAHPDGGFPGYIHTTYGMAAAQYRRGEVARADLYLGKSERYLQSRPDIHDITWGLVRFVLGGVPASHHTVRAYLGVMADMRQADGTWPTENKGSEVHFTLEALEIMQAYGTLRV